MATVDSGYPLDTTGSSPNNKVTGELHSFPSKQGRVFALNYGAFFAHTVKLHDKASGKELTDSQYFVAYRLDFPSAQYKSEVCALIMVTDEAVGLDVLVDYQALGGIYSYAGDNLATVLRRALTAKRSMYWPAVVEPFDTDNRNDYKLWPMQRIGFEHGTMALSRLKEAIRYGDIASYRAVGQYAKDQSAPIPQLARDLLNAKLAVHIQSDNPHAQYVRRDALDNYLPWVRTPVNMAPVPNSRQVARQGATLAASAYRPLYGVPLGQAEFQVATTPSFANPISVVATSNQAVVADTLAAGTKYYWRVRYQNAEGQTSAWSNPTDFTTA